MFKRCKTPQDYYEFAIKIRHAYPDVQRRSTIAEWLAENCHGAYMVDDQLSFYESCYRFQVKEDAALFALFWTE
jgi:hypothetical protein